MFMLYFCFSGRLNVKQEEIDEMLKEAPGPINFTVFLTMFGEKLKGKSTQAKGTNQTIKTIRAKPRPSK